MLVNFRAFSKCKGSFLIWSEDLVSYQARIQDLCKGGGKRDSSDIAQQSHGSGRNLGLKIGGRGAGPLAPHPPTHPPPRSAPAYSVFWENLNEIPLCIVTMQCQLRKEKACWHKQFQNLKVKVKISVKQICCTVGGVACIIGISIQWTSTLEFFFLPRKNMFGKK